MLFERKRSEIRNVQSYKVDRIRLTKLRT
eukprot:SAG31_NODE_14876_length_782_cov_1.295754_2_plen_28_part_01